MHSRPISHQSRRRFHQFRLRLQEVCLRLAGILTTLLVVGCGAFRPATPVFLQAGLRRPHPQHPNLLLPQRNNNNRHPISCWFQPPSVQQLHPYSPPPSSSFTATKKTSTTSLLSEQQNVAGEGNDDEPGNVTDKTKKSTRRIWNRFFGKAKKLHDPITYFVMGILFGFRYDWCFKSPIYWFAIGFTIKWYRARYVFKIPVWDRQPNWNNIITSKEQEKDLKAFTCKNCGSTLFIAKTREFFFEGNTGIGGLGCFSCGAKGKENFIQDRDRILEDVGDKDDYFEYERPLDFVSRAERRKLMKETKGDEEKANQILLDRSGAESSSSSTSSEEGTDTTDGDIDAVTEGGREEQQQQTQEAEEPSAGGAQEDADNDKGKEEATDAVVEEPQGEQKPDVTEEPNGGKTYIMQTSSEGTETRPQPSENEEEVEKPKKKTIKKKKKKKSSPTAKSTSVSSSVDLDGLDELDMDAW